MMISTKGRYALRVMIDLAQQKSSEYVSLKEIAERQEVSMKYLEAIVAILNKEGLLKSMRGAHGGYRLAYPAEKYTVAQIMKLTEGSLAPVSCLECNDNQCSRMDVCLTLPMWQHLDMVIDQYLSGITLADLVERRV